MTDSGSDRSSSRETRQTRHTVVVPNSVNMVSLLGPGDEHLALIERSFGADVHVRGNRITLQGDPGEVALAERLLDELVTIIRTGQGVTGETVVWGNFGAVLKEGLIADVESREQLLAVATFESTRVTGSPAEESDSGEAASGEAGTTIAEYVSRMVEGQEEIYYLNGSSRAAVESSPHLEAFRARGVEVLVLTDPVDEVWVDAVGEVDGKRLRSVAKGDVDLSGIGTDTAEKKDAPDAAEYTDLLTWLGEELSEEVKQVRLSQRLTESAACMVGDEFDMTPQLEAMYREIGRAS